MGVAHQALHKVVTFAHEHTPSNRQVSVKPGVPEASPIWLHIHAHKPRLEAVGDWLQLQAWAAAAPAEQLGMPTQEALAGLSRGRVQAAGHQPHAAMQMAQLFHSIAWPVRWLDDCPLRLCCSSFDCPHLSVWAPIMWKPLPVVYLLPMAKATMVEALRVK